MAIDFDRLVLGPCIATFGEAVPGDATSIPLYAPKDSASFGLNGVFDEEHTEITVDQGAPVSTVKPVLGIRLSDFPAGVAPRQGDQVTVRGTLFNVADIEPDGQGGAKLVLMEASDE